MHCSILIICRPNRLRIMSDLDKATPESIKNAIEAAELDLNFYLMEHNNVLDYYDANAKEHPWLATAICRKEGPNVQACPASEFFEFTEEGEPFMILKDCILYDSRDYDTWEAKEDELILDAIEEPITCNLDNWWFVVVDAHI